MARAFLKVYFDFDEKTEELSDAEKARLLWAMYSYAKTGERKPLTGNERFLFGVFKSKIDRDIANYNAKVANGSQGGRPAMKNLTETEENLTKPNETENNLNAKNKNKEQDIKDTLLKESTEKRKRFTPPTVEEVDAYCKERGNKINPQTFCDYYQSRGWRVGSSNSPMKDWRACVRTWEQRDDKCSPQKPRVLRAQDYEQREYKEAEMRDILGVDDLYKEDVS